MTVVYRRARSDELEAAARVFCDGFEQYRPGSEASCELRQALDGYLALVADARARLRDAELFVADDGGDIIGAAGLYPPHAPSPHRSDVHERPWPDDWAILRMLAVDPRRRGEGIARGLTDARVARARALGATAVALHTSPLFEVSRGMYRRRGWRRAPEYDFAPVPEIQVEAYVLTLT